MEKWCTVHRPISAHAHDPVAPGPWRMVGREQCGDKASLASSSRQQGTRARTASPWWHDRRRWPSRRGVKRHPGRAPGDLNEPTWHG
jgi:hypothetical protein